MPISPAAIKAFLDRPYAYAPNTKEMSLDDIERLVIARTGIPLQFKIQPRLSQFEGIAFGLFLGRVLWFHGMRLGKTKMALDWAEHLKRSGQWKGTGLILAPVPVIANIWETQATRYTNLKTAKCGTTFESLLTALDQGPDLVICSLSSIQQFLTEKRLNRKKKPQLYLSPELCEEFANLFSLGIIDEIHNYAEPYGLPFEIASAITAQCKWMAGLTGTPFGRDPFRLWAQAFLIDRGETLGRSPRFFEQAYGKKETMYFAGGKERWVFDKKKLPLLQARIDTIAQSYQREELLEHVTKNVIELKMEGDQRKAYEEALSELVKIKEGLVEIGSVFIRTRQIASGYLPFDDVAGTRHVMKFDRNVKLEWFRALLADLPEGLQFIVFHEYTISGQLLCDELAKAKIKHGWLHGGPGDKTKQVAEFESGKIQAMVVQAAAGSLGIELAAADYMLFYESPVDPIIRHQAEMRALGDVRGNRPLILDDLACSRVEHHVMELVQEGKDMMQEILHGRREKWFKV